MIKHGIINTGGKNMLYALYCTNNDELMIKLSHQEKIAPFTSTKEVLFSLCLNYGATYEGRRTATSKILNIKQKVPIFLSNNELLFPTHSPDHKECAWINYYAILDYHKHQKGCLFVFIDGSEIILPCSIRTIKTQMERCQKYQQHMFDYDISN